MLSTYSSPEYIASMTRVRIERPVRKEEMLAAILYGKEKYRLEKNQYPTNLYLGKVEMAELMTQYGCNANWQPDGSRLHDPESNAAGLKVYVVNEESHFGFGSHSRPNPPEVIATELIQMVSG